MGKRGFQKDDNYISPMAKKSAYGSGPGLTEGTEIDDFVAQLNTLNGQTSGMLQSIDAPEMKQALESLLAITKTCGILLKKFNSQEIHDVMDEERRQHSIVISGLPEAPIQSSPTAQAKLDLNNVLEVMDCCLVNCLPSNVYRMGRRSDKPRLIKLELPTKGHTRLLLRNRGMLKSSTNNKQIFVRESLSFDQRTARKKLNDECSQKRQDTGRDYVVYAEKVILRSDIKKPRRNEEEHD